jgi:DNA mismatch repair protein MutS2
MRAVPRALEFDRIVAVVRGQAATPLGRDGADRLAPDDDPARVARQLAVTLEAVRLLDETPGLPLRAAEQLPEVLEALALEGRPLDAPSLAELASFVESIDRSAILIRREDERLTLPLLKAIAGRVVSFAPEVTRVRRAIDAAGNVVDDASPTLKSLRERLRRQRARLRSTLESYLRSRDTAKYLQEQVVTDRNGRYVLVVRAEHRGAIPGIVHGASTSGASLYLEPLSTVEVNNDIVALEEQEAEEVRRILGELTGAFRARGAELDADIEAAAELDLVQARARFSRLVDGVAPALSTDGAVVLRSARHPLLLPAVIARLDERREGRDRPPEPVPVDLTLEPPSRVLVITGPNTGGKTVALKTMGLLSVMAQSGLLVPAAPGSTVPVFRAIFADIGDEQSIAASLSTFSSHIANIASMDRELTLPALVLLDEVGTGTDPIEGGALATAIIDHFRARGAHLLATTHYDVLKSYASTTEGVVCASFGFEPTTFAPTYRLRYGTPGASLALEIAARLGLAPAMVDAARSLRSSREAQLAEHLAKVDREVQRLDHERRILARERTQLAEQQAQLGLREQALRQREEGSKKRLEEGIAAQLRDARHEIDAAMADLKRRTDALAAEAARRSTHHQPALSTGETGRLRIEARESIDKVSERFRDLPAGTNPLTGRPADARPAGPLEPGARVAVGPLGLEGVVQTVSGREAEVMVHGKRLRVPVDSLAVRGPASGSTKVSVQVQLREEPHGSDLNVIGRSVDEALSLADKFLDDALVGSQRVIRLIHGHGKGHLRRALAAFLQDHPQVERFGPAPAEQGGQGVTVVELKE